MHGRNGSTFEDPEKRQAILDQAIRTFAECGFRGTDVQVIADGAGVGKGTVYRYFGNKEDLFWATTFEVMLRLERHLSAAMKEVQGAYAKLRASGIAYAEFFEANPQCLEVFVQDRAEFRGVGPESHREYHEKLTQRYAEIVQQGIAAGEFRPVDPRTITLALASVLYGSVVLACHVHHGQSITEVTRHIVEIFLEGIRVPTACPITAS